MTDGWEHRTTEAYRYPQHLIQPFTSHVSEYSRSAVPELLQGTWFVWPLRATMSMNHFEIGMTMVKKHFA